MGIKHLCLAKGLIQFFQKNFREILCAALWLQAAEWRRAEKNRLIVIQLDGRRVIADHFIISQLNIKKIVQ